MKFSKQFWDMLQELVSLLGGQDQIQEIEIERRFWGGKIRITKAGKDPVVSASLTEPLPSSETTEPVGLEADDRYHPVQSPMVGMFYRAPSPDAPAYVEEGDVVSPGQTLCIIEAMKIMNEIESDVKGRVVRVLIENESPVEYNTPLFLLEPLP
ncbi:MAG: acetyl-CoA carboxylase biotin carboxyl carrier protein [bacterium]|nr:acetyl-CoA carboxylase biotin carboxyl carrier protein [bacterium]